MKLKASEDVDAPIEQVFRLLSDIDNLERLAARRGVDIVRGSEGPVQEGSSWQVNFRLRGKDRSVDMVLEQMQPSNHIAVKADGGGVSGLFAVELVALTPKCTRVRVSLDMAASSISGRLLLQSLKLAKSKVEQRFRERMRKFAAVLEERLTDYA